MGSLFLLFLPLLTDVFASDSTPLGGQFSADPIRPGPFSADPIEIDEEWYGHLKKEDEFYLRETGTPRPAVEQEVFVVEPGGPAVVENPGTGKRGRGRLSRSPSLPGRIRSTSKKSETSRAPPTSLDHDDLDRSPSRGELEESNITREYKDPASPACRLLVVRLVAPLVATVVLLHAAGRKDDLVVDHWSMLSLGLDENVAVALDERKRFFRDTLLCSWRGSFIRDETTSG